MPARSRFAVVLTPLLALLGVAAAVLLPSAAAPAAAQSPEPAVTCFEITVGWRICAAPAVAPIAAASPLPQTTLSYGAPVTTGSVTDAGSYAFLTDPDDLTTLVTTYEGLRDGSTTGLVVHQNDGAGASQADFYGLVEAGDVVEWREAAACWVRYRVTEVKDDPAGDPPRTLLAVKAYSHAYTGCSGTISGTESRAFTWTPTLVQRGNITVPIWHGPFLVAPTGWTETTLPVRTPRIPDTGPWPPPIAEMPDPDLGPGWTGGVAHGLYEGLLEGYYGYSGGGRVTVYIYPLLVSPFSVRSIDNADTDGVLEYFLLDGRPARVAYDREFDVTSHAFNSVIVYDEATDLIIAADGGRRADGNDPTTLIAIVRKFLAAVHPNSCQPRAPTGESSNDTADLGLPDCGLPSTTLTYGAPVTTGSVTDDGDYAFLTDPDDLTTLVTTYEGLRDGSTTGLVIHQSDSGGTSQAAFYDLVEAGDIIEWREADDCWVRYEVTEVKADPAGTAPRKEFAVEWKAYAFTGCTGSVATDAAVSVTWGPKPNFLSPRITVPVRHGSYQIIPHGWTGTTEEAVRVAPPASQASGTAEDSTQPAWPSDDPAEVRQHPLWNEPDLPDRWQISVIWAESERSITAIYSDSEGYLAAHIWILQPRSRPVNIMLSIFEMVEEARTIDGHPTFLEHDNTGASASIFDETTGILYTAFLYPNEDDPDGRDIDDAIAIARSLYR